MARWLAAAGATWILVSAAVGQEPWRAAHDQAARLLASGGAREAIAQLDECLQAHDRAAPLFLLRARCKREVDDLPGAMLDAVRAIELAPDLADAWVERGYLKARRRDLSGAIADYDEAIRLAPRHAVAFGDRGDARQQLGELLAARDDYDAALRIDPDFGPALHNRALANMGLGAWATAARDQARAIRLTPPMDRMWWVLASAQERIGRWSNALTSVAQGLKCKPATPGLLLGISARAHWRLGEHAAAIRDRERAIAEAGSPAEAASYRHHLACCYLATDQLAKARELFEACLDDPRMHPWATVMLWCTDADNDAADRALRKAIDKWPLTTPPLPRRVAESCLAPAALPPTTKDDDVGFTCATSFLHGWRARRSGKPDAARRCFFLCLDTGYCDYAQWQIAFAMLGLAADAAASLGCELREVADARPPRLEVAAVTPEGPAALQGLRVGDRIAQLNDQPATAAAVDQATRQLVIGTPVRFLVEREGKDVVVWVAAGAAR